MRPTYRLLLLVIVLAVIGVASYKERSKPESDRPLTESADEKITKKSMQALLKLDPGNPPEELNVIVEIPKGSLNKYEYNAKLRVMELDRVIGADLRYPIEYGFIPQTLMPDGDPLDFIMPMTEPTHPGILVEARPIGIMQMLDGEDLDDKIVTVAIKDPRFSDVQTLEDLPEALRKEIETFFSTYKSSEGKTTSVPGWKDKDAAMKLIEEALEAYEKD